MNSITDRFEFRDIRPEEFDRAAEIEQIVFPPNEAGFPDDIREQARIAPDCFLVAADREDGGIAGLLYGIATNENRFRDAFFTDKTLHDPQGSNIMLLGLDIVPEYQGQGLGRALMNHAMEYIRGMLKPGWHVMVSLMAAQGKEDFYKKFGFITRPDESHGCGMCQWIEA